MVEYDNYVRDIMKITRQMIIVADDGEANCDNDNHAVLFGVVRDCAYKIKKQIESENS